MATKVVAVETAPGPWAETRGCSFLMEREGEWLGPRWQRWDDELDGVREELRGR